MDSNIEERFQAAVNVIKGLPKNGPYQPSTTMMLKFYGLYKQAVEGPCHQKKPAFWDMVGKAKWDAWNSNKHLTQKQAMKKYVDELKDIIETMSFTENVQNFVGSISGGLDNIDLDDLEMVVPGMREIAESHPDSPFNSRTNSPQHGTSSNNSTNENGVTNGHNNRTYKEHVNSSLDDNNGPIFSENESNKYQDLANNKVVHSCSSLVEQSDDEYVDPDEMHNDYAENAEMLKQIQLTISRLNADISVLSQRMSSTEKCVKETLRHIQSKKSDHSSRSKSKYPAWWPFENISPLWFTVLILWPFIFRRLGNMLTTSKRTK